MMLVGDDILSVCSEECHGAGKVFELDKSLCICSPCTQGTVANQLLNICVKEFALLQCLDACADGVCDESGICISCPAGTVSIFNTCRASTDVDVCRAQAQDGQYCAESGGIYKVAVCGQTVSHDQLRCISEAEACEKRCRSSQLQCNATTLQCELIVKPMETGSERTLYMASYITAALLIVGEFFLFCFLSGQKKLYQRNTIVLGEQPPCKRAPSAEWQDSSTQGEVLLQMELTRDVPNPFQ